MQYRWGEVDGVTTLSPANGTIPGGPLTAGLTFGVGRADETMAVSGITHLVEHLALQRIGHTPFGFNGEVGPRSTAFLAIGNRDQIVGFFRSVTQHLSDLPLERLADESRVLRVEERREGGYQLGMDLSRRFGPRGPGLLGWPQHGLVRLEPEEVVQWARSWFTARNSVFWISGPVPPDLDLSALPDGDPPARAALSPAALPGRTWIGANVPTVSISMLSGQQPGVGAAMDIAQRRAFTRLRQRDALSYAVERAQLVLADGCTLEYIQADGLAEAFPRILEGLVGVIEELADAGPSADEMQLSREMYDQSFDHPGTALGYLIGAAKRRLLGMPDRSPDELRDGFRALTPHQLRDGLAEILPTLLAVGPKEIGEEPPGWRVEGVWSRDRVTGVEYEPIDDREEGTLVVSAEGVSWVAPDERCRTVRWDETVACFTWDDGSRTLLGPAGEFVRVAPWDWRGGHALTGLVDDETDPHRRIRLGEGETLYLQDPVDPASTTDVRWLGSLIAARYDGSLVDLVIDTDGLFLLFDEPSWHPSGVDFVPSALHTRRLQARRASSRDELLGADPRNQWVPARDIEHATVTVRPFGWGRTKATLRIITHDAGVFVIKLVKADQVQIVRNQFPKVLGSRFVG